MSSQEMVQTLRAHDTDVLLEDVMAFVRLFVVLSDAQADAIALWTLHTHTFESWDATPYLEVTSATKRSGKTRLLETLQLLVARPLSTANISDAALFRAIAQERPTLLFDETDAIWKNRDREDLRKLLNAGSRRGTPAYRMGGGNNTTLQKFDVFCPKALAGIGRLPDTLADRSIPIRLERKLHSEQVHRLRQRKVVPDAADLRMRIEGWAEMHSAELERAEPSLPDELDDRAADGWEPLLAIADLAGGDWPMRARAAALVLSAGEGRSEDESLGVLLLGDILAVFEEQAVTRIKTSELLWALGQIDESPWGDWHGKTITPQALAKILKPFRIRTLPVWVDGEKARGYKREQFEDAWTRYRPAYMAVGAVGAVGAASRAEAGATTPTGPTAHHAGGGNGRVLVPGDDGFLDLVAERFAADHLTMEEVLELQRLHDGRRTT
jgi:hypothetical protein